MAEWKTGQVILDDYLIEKELGQGGMGRVWLAKSNSTGRRFAVKQTLLKDEKHRKAFLTELQTWIDLPEHPNIVPCRFFRTVGDEIVIFADFIEGGSLADWIAKRKLTTLEQILDVAIQFAWGLHAIHERGLIHQDVKPGNVLMASDGSIGTQWATAKLTDYGLARARSAGCDHLNPTSSQSILISSGGYTPAYCSPEQAQGLPVTSKTDVWSWGVSVLEMFTSEVTWQSGQVAGEVLEMYIEQPQKDDAVPAMPASLAEVLRGCFRSDPGMRWENLEQAIERLKVVYHEVTGAAYTRLLKRTERHTTPKAGVRDRHTREGARWTDPRDWLQDALRADGRDPREASNIVAKNVASRRGQLVVELTTFGEARRIYERLVKDGRRELETDLAALCMGAAFVHETADDYPGAMALYDEAIDILERLVTRDKRDDIADTLAMAYMNKATAAIALKDSQTAIALCDRAIHLLESLINTEPQVNVARRQKLSNDLVLTYANKANALRAIGDTQAAVVLFDAAICICERLADTGRRHELASELASLYMNKAIAVRAGGDNRAAVMLLDRAIAIYEPLVNVEGRSDLADELAMSYGNKANALSALGDEERALSLFDQAIGLRKHLVEVQGRSELTANLAMVLANKAGALVRLGNKQEAATLYDRAIEIVERLVTMEGRSELADTLSALRHNRTIVASEADDSEILTDDHDAVILEVSHDDVVHCDISAVARGLDHLLQSRRRVVAGRGRIALALSGYDSDTRELYEIPEVRRYVEALDSVFPYWFYFAHPQYGTLKLFALCLCRVVKVPGGSTPEIEDLKRFIYQHVVSLNQLCEKFSLGDAVKTEVTNDALQQLLPSK